MSFFYQGCRLIEKVECEKKKEKKVRIFGLTSQRGGGGVDGGKRWGLDMKKKIIHLVIVSLSSLLS